MIGLDCDNSSGRAITFPPSRYQPYGVASKPMQKEGKQRKLGLVFVKDPHMSGMIMLTGNSRKGTEKDSKIQRLGQM